MSTGHPGSPPGKKVEPPPIPVAQWLFSHTQNAPQSALLRASRGQIVALPAPVPCVLGGSPAGAEPFVNVGPLSFLMFLLPSDLGLSAVLSLRNPSVCTPLVSDASFPSLFPPSLLATLPLPPPSPLGQHCDVRDPLQDPLGRPRLALATDLSSRPRC